MNDENSQILESELLDHRDTFFGVIDISKREGKFYVIRFPYNDNECVIEEQKTKSDIRIPWSHFRKCEQRNDAFNFAKELEELDAQRLDKVEKKVDEIITLLNSLPRLTMKSKEYIQRLQDKIQASVL